MGITRKYDELRPIRIEDVDDFNYNDFDLSESGDEYRVEHENPVTTTNAVALPFSKSKKNKERRAERRLRKFIKDASNGCDEICIKNNMGARKWRRVENARLLLSLANKDDICTDFSDIVSPTVSSFQHLFMEKENMKLWNEFVECSEEEQKLILECGWDSLNNVESSGWFVVGGKKSVFSGAYVKNHDGRRHHPAFSAKSCFERLNSSFKRLLAEKHLPWAFIHYIESQLCVFFEGNSGRGRVFIGRFESPRHRVIVHAVAQFLRLTSKSVTDRDSGIRVMEIRNERPFFIRPLEGLIEFLSSRRKEPINFAPLSEDAIVDLNSILSSV